MTENNLIRKSFTIEATPELLLRFERLLALLHFNTAINMDQQFGLLMKAEDQFVVEDMNFKHAPLDEIALITTIPYDTYLATEDGYTGTFTDPDQPSRWCTYPPNRLYEDGKCIKVKE